MSQENKTREKHISPFSIEYVGKQPIQSILSSSYSSYKKIFSIAPNQHNNLFFYADNQDAMLYLLNNGYKNKIKLIYIDPPYSTNSSFLNKNQELAYNDFITGSEYIEFLRSRLVIMHQLLSEYGSIYVHLDSRMLFYIKIILDEIFGPENFRSLITRKKCSTKNYTKKTYGNIADYILFYSKSKEYVWNRPLGAWDEDKIKEQYPCINKENNRRYKKVPIHALGNRNGETGKAWRGMLPPKGKHWQYTPKILDEMDSKGEIYWSPSGNPRRIIFFDPNNGIPIQNIWMEYRDSINQAQKTVGYPTEKNMKMLEMILSASSNENDIILDCFAGSGTTLGAAYNLNRKWIGIDNSKESLKSILIRFTKGMTIHGDYVNKSKTSQLQLDINIKCPIDIFTTESEIDAATIICNNLT